MVSIPSTSDSQKNKILVTGGAGYIGSHATISLLEAGFQVVIIDNLSNSKQQVINWIEAISKQSVEFLKIDLRDREALQVLFKQHDFFAVMHFAGLKAVNESVQQPLKYHENNVLGSLNLFQVMEQHGVKRLIFSSSATVYGDTRKLPIDENSILSSTSPYGSSKLIIENILKDLAKADSQWQIAILRYFNPIGAHASGLLGESPLGVPNNLMPYICQVAAGVLEKLSIFGNDYSTRDGTGVRDYIHVMDLIDGHLKALQKISQYPSPMIYNLGSGTGYSVLQILKTFERVNQIQVPYIIAERRKGDVAACYADNSLAKECLQWSPQYNLSDMCVDTWRWHQNFLQGSAYYGES